MDLADTVIQMESHAQAIQALARSVPRQAERWRPDPDAWSALDVMDHLAHEETHDFRDRLDLVLHRPNEAWPEADPARGVSQGDTQRTLEESLEAFLTAREQSLAWLRGLDAPDWRAVHRAPFGQISAGDVLAAWVAHDLLHLRQLIELRYQILTRHVEPYGVRYAGRW